MVNDCIFINMDNPKFLIVATGWNCDKYVQRSIDSVIIQTYDNYAFAFIDDHSIDGTFKYIKQTIPFFSESKIRSGLIRKQVSNVGTVTCRDNAILLTKADFDIIVWLDLDDELMPNALQVLADTYNKTDCWLTYGNYQDSHGRIFNNEYSDLVKCHKAYRQTEFKFVHLRSFRKELYFKLAESDLYPDYILKEAQNAYPDLNMLLCLLEMCPPEKIQYIDQVLYRYNDSNPLSALNRFRDKRQREFEAVRLITPKETIYELT